MNEQQIAARLVAIHTAYVEKTGRQPYLDPKVWITASGRVEAWMRGRNHDDHLDAPAKTIDEALTGLAAMVAAIPSADEQARRDAARAVAKAIEACRSAGYDAEYINPLMETAKRISENALTYEAAE